MTGWTPQGPIYPPWGFQDTFGVKFTQWSALQHTHLESDNLQFWSPTPPSPNIPFLYTVDQPDTCPPCTLSVHLWIFTPSSNADFVVSLVSASPPGLSHILGAPFTPLPMSTLFLLRIMQPLYPKFLVVMILILVDLLTFFPLAGPTALVSPTLLVHVVTPVLVPLVSEDGLLFLIWWPYTHIWCHYHNL